MFTHMECMEKKTQLTCYLWSYTLKITAQIGLGTLEFMCSFPLNSFSLVILFSLVLGFNHLFFRGISLLFSIINV